MTKKTKKPAPKVQQYAGCVLALRPDGVSVDVCDPVTGRWSAFTSMRSAKWSATVYNRLSHVFGRGVATETQLTQIVNQLTNQ